MCRILVDVGFCLYQMCACATYIRFHLLIYKLVIIKAYTYLYSRVNYSVFIYELLITHKLRHKWKYKLC